MQKPSYTGVDDIMSFYDTMNIDGEYVYSLWYGDKNIVLQYFGDDRERGRKLLNDCLTAYEQAGNDNMFSLKFHMPDTKHKPVERKTPVVSSTYIRAVELDDSQVSEISGITSSERPNGMPYQMWQAINGLQSLPTVLTAKLTEFDERLKAMEILPEDEVPEPSQIEKTMAIVNGIAGNPTLMGIIGQVLGYLKPAAPVYGVAPRISGMVDNADQVTVQPEEKYVPNEDTVNQALAILEQHCKLDEDLMKLANIAVNNPGQFAMLLNMLRSF